MSGVAKKKSRIDIASIRREQIVEAAVAVIAERGLQHLSLSEIEKKVGMARGQLTYYFKTKEDILLAVFDRLLQLMCRRNQEAEGPPFPGATWYATVEKILQAILQQPPWHLEFHCLHHTFLAQVSHRADFRQRLARLYEDWRQQMSRHLAEDLQRRPALRPVSPRALATLVQAIFHGLATQSAVDPQAIDAVEIVNLCQDMLGIYLWNQEAALTNGKAKKRRPNRVTRKNQAANGAVKRGKS